MHTTVIYSALDSSEIVATDSLRNTETPKRECKEEPTTSAFRMLGLPPDPTWEPRPLQTRYLEPTSPNYNTEARLLFPYYRPSTRKFNGSPNDPSVFMKRQSFAKKYRHRENYYAECMAQEIKRCE